MALENALTSADEPGEILTSDVEPESPIAVSTPEGGAPPDALDARVKRLEANIKGTKAEYEREKAARERAEGEAQQLRNWMMQQQTAQQQPAPAPAGPSYDDLEKARYDATIEGNVSRLTEIGRQQREIIRREEAEARNRELQQLGQMAYQQQTLQRYMGELGPEAQPKVEARARQIATDPKFVGVHGNDPRMIAIMATEQVRAESKAGVSSAKEQAREESSNGAFTEGSRGAAPGKTVVPKAKMTFSAEEMKLIHYDMRRHGMTEEDAKKRFWNAMRPETRDARLARK